jgi:quinoprotein glucose dehydrogenase
MRFSQLSAAVVYSAAALVSTATPLAAQSPGEWSAYGHDALGSRFSPLTQITRENVAQLKPAWTYRTGDADVETRKPVKFEATPLMVDGTLFLSTPFGRVIALDPETGRERWTFDAHADRQGGWGDFANRGVSTWLDARAAKGASCRRRIYLGTIDARIIARGCTTRRSKPRNMP